MKKFVILIVSILIITMLASCAYNHNGNEVGKISRELKKGDNFTITGIVDYSDEPSDIGQNYCFITGDVKIEYTYTDIYDMESKWASNVFYTKGNDTNLLKEYVGQQVKVSGILDTECHGIPYITNVDILK